VHREVSRAICSAAAASSRLGVEPTRDKWLCCLPLSHVSGLGVVTRALLTATPLVVHERFDADAVRRAALDGATLVSLVPTALGRVDASSFRRVLVGGDAPGRPLADNVVATYGLTETAGGVVYDGRCLDGVEVRIGDGHLGAPGEVLVRAPMCLRCYRDGRDPRLADGWMATGDGGRLDDVGRLVVDGRLAEVIVTGGEKVWPRPLEAVLIGHPKVADAMVVGRPDPEWGAQVVAVVVPTDAATPPTLDELRDHVRTTQAPYAAPRRLELVDAIARSANGKVERRGAR